ncbi:hypothetical protein TSTA_058620 [Talaromyces stipitatus ATCC 10500]|uniref:Uncharacterized protein n=1 Tax=Talaromyces stipitatus (strain ATCC 10500 / CBS 375.48 / QM 6759 / NRRL 1006) TaxID=441959 RepID=B8MQH1_TALSN|nr:uncharacterized protein TSTA_058620 [Talaromyces stipitatus ATCC 10500]EED13373.1 hypothetical protein TSTA_058620 [Talaromyces stipitatus ATCC 10500]
MAADTISTENSNRLARRIQKDVTASAALKASWQSTKRMSVGFTIRTKEVALMFPMNALSGQKSCNIVNKGCWRQMVRQATQELIKFSQCKNYDGKAKSKICGPWGSICIEQSIEDWNNEVIMEAGIVFDEDDHWRSEIKLRVKRLGRSLICIYGRASYVS